VKNNLDSHSNAYTVNILYDFDNQVMLNWYPQRIINFTKGLKSILELGLGHGYTTEIFSKSFSRHMVLDGSSTVIKNFTKKFPYCSAQIVETLFENFESDEKFDVIVLGFVLEHVENPIGIINHFKNFLSPVGKMFITVPNAYVLNRRLGSLAGLLPDMQKLSENDILLGHKRYYTISSLTEDIMAAGCQIERLEGIYLKPFTTNQILSLNLNKKIINALCEIGIDYPELSCGILAQLRETR
jgi:2-polyprenyl-3-methyl-5-hydroxy-6-metoxy-1,4-benzoquinol methylase